MIKAFWTDFSKHRNFLKFLDKLDKQNAYLKINFEKYYNLDMHHLTNE